MFKKIIKISIFCTTIIAFPIAAHASAIITEIMYDLDGTDTGREWIEVENTGNSAIDLSTWKFFEANTNHKITAIGAAILSAGGYAVIADVPDKFNVDHPGFSGLLFDSTFSLSNEGETLVLRDENAADVDTVSYIPAWGAGGNGNSLQRTQAGSWIEALPTPGAPTTATQSSAPPASNSNQNSSSNSTSTPDTSSNTTTNTNSGGQISVTYSTHASQSVANISYDEPQLEVTSGRSRLGFVGVPLSFEAKVKSIKNVPVGNAVASTWSMGDGTQLSGQFVSHVFEFPGEYNVILNSDTGGADAVSKVKVKILDPKLAITDATSDYIEIANLDDYEVNIGKWIVETDKTRFIAPQDTLISPHSSIKLPASSTKINALKEYVRIANPAGKILSTLSLDGGRIVASNMANGPMVMLPQGSDISVIQKRLAVAFAPAPTVTKKSLAKAVTTKKKQTVAVQSKTSVQKSSPKYDLVLRDADPPSIGTSTMAASVIYTVGDKPEKSWWSSLMNIFKK